MFGDNKILKIENRDKLGIVNIFFTIQGEGPFAGMPAIFIRLGGCNLACKFCDTEFDEFTYMTIDEILTLALDKTKNYFHNIQQNDNSDNEDKNFNHFLNTANTTDYIASNDINQLILQKKYLVVITGGEPFRQNISPLCNKLLKFGFKIQIETNGSIWRDLDEKVEIVYSPKVIKSKNFLDKNQTNIDNFFYPRPDVRFLSRIKSLKILISNYHPRYSDIPNWLKVDLNDFHNFNKLNSNIVAKLGNNNIFLQPIDEYDEEKNKKNLELAIKLSMKYNLRLGMQLHKIINVE